MPYFDSRAGQELDIDTLTAILEGKVSDGLITKSYPNPFTDSEIAGLKASFPDLAIEVISKFFDDINKAKISEFCKKAYSPENFDTDEIEPVVKLGNNYHLEQWHGKTAAFKDIALSVLPYFMQEALSRETDIEKVLILGATSGDTGSAGEAGFYSIPEVYIGVTYPENANVTEIQKRQMIDFQTDDSRISAYSILDNFDYCQNEIVKPLLNDKEFRGELLNKYKCKLSSLNSINIGRIGPQIVSFFWAYSKIGRPFIPVVPSGNFGHALSAFLAKQMGIFMPKIIIATNENDVLYRFIKTGVCKAGQFKTTNSPSMDISIPSNLERLLYYIAGAEKTNKWMNDLKTSNEFAIDTETHNEIKKIFDAVSVNEQETLDEIKEVWEQDARILDPHTAVASRAAKSDTSNIPKLILETAHWGKFVQTIYQALGFEGGENVPGKWEIEGMKKIDKIIEEEGGAPGLTKYLSMIEDNDNTPRRCGNRPSADEMKDCLMEQLK